MTAPPPTDPTESIAAQARASDFVLDLPDKGGLLRKPDQLDRWFPCATTLLV